MSSDPKTPKAPKHDGGTADPDNIYTDGTPESATDAPLAGKPGTVKPDNIYTDGTKQ